MAGTPHNTATGNQRSRALLGGEGAVDCTSLGVLAKLGTTVNGIEHRVREPLQTRNGNMEEHMSAFAWQIMAKQGPQTNLTQVVATLRRTLDVVDRHLYPGDARKNSWGSGKRTDDGCGARADLSGQLERQRGLPRNGGGG